MRLLAFSAVLGVLVVPAWADWDPGDPYKMHFPQLPNPTGWDVNATAPKVLADDWQCTESGLVRDIHFWGSWRQDVIGVIQRFHLSIHADIPRNPEGGIPFSRPGEVLWERDFLPGQWTQRLYGTGEQGWFEPDTGDFSRPDHQQYFQYNFETIPNAFYQHDGTIYWLDVSATIANPSGTHWGWKSTLDHFQDDAVWGDYPNFAWEELFDPETGFSLDLAFVITPEPTSLLLIGLGALALRRR